MGLRGASARVRLAAALVMALVLTLALAGVPRAADYDEPGYPEYPEHPEGDDKYDRRKSTWEINTSLTFHRYLQPFPRVESARACRDRCASNRRCTGWTYYDANFDEAGRFSYRLQRLCVLGAGVKNKQSGSRPGRTSGIVGSAHHQGD